MGCERRGALIRTAAGGVERWQERQRARARAGPRRWAAKLIIL